MFPISAYPACNRELLSIIASHVLSLFVLKKKSEKMLFLEVKEKMLFLEVKILHTPFNMSYFSCLGSLRLALRFMASSKYQS